MLCKTTSSCPDKLLRLCEVSELTALKKTTIYKRIRLELFPKQTQVGAPGAQRGTARWTLSSISSWIEAQKLGETWTCVNPTMTNPIEQKLNKGALQ